MIPSPGLGRVDAIRKPGWPLGGRYQQGPDRFALIADDLRHSGKGASPRCEAPFCLNRLAVRCYVEA